MTSLIDAMLQTRERTFSLIAHLDDADLERTPDRVMSPLAWDLGHIAAYEDLWINHRLAGLPLLRPGLAELYDAFETPRAVRAEARFLCRDELRQYMHDVRERALAAPVGDGLTHELVMRHELQHTETMLQAMRLAGCCPPELACPGPLAAGGDLDFRAVEPGECEIGASDVGFAYDNERPRHVVSLPGYEIASTPVQNGTWCDWIDAGGYERRDWWSQAGWAWRDERNVVDHEYARTGDPRAAVVHVCFHEAAAFARAHGARLPTEFEWERAAAEGRLAGIGEVWEWTCSSFKGYDGFRAHPYREYSEVFFGDSYRVLRGWACVSAERVRSIHFRNWDLPQRRQLFAGVRLARGAD